MKMGKQRPVLQKPLFAILIAVSIASIYYFGSYSPPPHEVSTSLAKRAV